MIRAPWLRRSSMAARYARLALPVAAFFAVPPGSYTVKVELAGFKR